MQCSVPNIRSERSEPKERKRTGLGKRELNYAKKAKSYTRQFLDGCSSKTGLEIPYGSTNGKKKQIGAASIT
ncbi:unnamed protein product [Hymenolepis diminuta]|uniref:Uncharacterized protein n=1 Tax=Hymenolepis diminuta TaxID=6216 RepID=A0A564YPA2_HYMDI|nr:unnamed protein product [Hymenolepis diminuta]